MAGFKFVGSQDRIEIPEGSQVVEISSLIPFTRIDIDPFDLLCSLFFCILVYFCDEGKFQDSDLATC